MLPSVSALNPAVEWESPNPLAACVAAAEASRSLVMGWGLEMLHCTTQSGAAYRPAPAAWQILISGLSYAETHGTGWATNYDLRSHFDNPPGWNLEIIRRIVGRPAQRDEQPILPQRHSRMRRRLQRSPRDKKRRRHDVELPAKLARDHQSLRNVRRFHETETEADGRELLADISHTNSIGAIYARSLRGFDRQDDVVFVKNLVVLEIVQKRGRCEIGIAGQKYRCALDDMRWPFFQALDEILKRHLGAPGL